MPVCSLAGRQKRLNATRGMHRAQKKLYKYVFLSIYSLNEIMYYMVIVYVSE